MATVAALSLENPFSILDGGSMRTRAFISALEQDRHSVSVLTRGGLVDRSDAEPTRAPENADRISRLKRVYLPMPTQSGQRSPAIRQHLRDTPPDIVLASVLSQAQFGSSSSSIFWLDFMDVWSDFGRREADVRSGLAAKTALAQSLWQRHQEKVYGSAADLVTAAGWTDTCSLRKRGIPAVWLPTPLKDSDFQSIIGTRTKVAGLIGNFNYWPNRDAYNFVVEHWLPDIRKQGWSLLLAGVGSRDLPLREGVESIGEISDVNDFYRQINVSLAPIRLGGGIKVKIAESYSRGVPVLGTPFAFEGFNPAMRGLGVVAQSHAPLPLLDTIRGINPDDPALRQLTMSKFSSTVHQILDESLRGSSPSTGRRIEKL